MLGDTPAVENILERGRREERMERTQGAEWAKRGGWQVRREEKTDWGEGGVEKEWVAGSKRVEGGIIVAKQQRERDVG